MKASADVLSGVVIITCAGAQATGVCLVTKLTVLRGEVGHSPIRAIVYAKEPDFWNNGCQVKSTDTGFRRCVKKYFAPIGSLSDNEQWDTETLHPGRCLEKALPVFWRRGFADASLHELEVATGVNKSGLYSEFKDKEDLFMQSLQYYLENLEKKGMLTAEPLGWNNISDSSSWDHATWRDKRDVLLSAPCVSLRYCRRKRSASSLKQKQTKAAHCQEY